jgi:hypothetical protein
MNPFYRPAVGLTVIGGLFVAGVDSKVDTPPSHAFGQMISLTASSTSSTMVYTFVANTIDEGFYDTWTGRRPRDFTLK